MCVGPSFELTMIFGRYPRLAVGAKGMSTGHLPGNGIFVEESGHDHSTLELWNFYPGYRCCRQVWNSLSLKVISILTFQAGDSRYKKADFALCEFIRNSLSHL